jgi:hypothetical protein
MPLNPTGGYYYENVVQDRKNALRLHPNCNPKSPYRQPSIYRYQVPNYAPDDWIVGDIIYGFNIISVLPSL